MRAKGLLTCLCVAFVAMLNPEARGEEPSSSHVTKEYFRVLNATPVPAELKNVDLPKGNKFALEAGTAEVVEQKTLRLTLVTKEANLPADTSCMVLCMSEGANLDNTIKLLRVFATTIGYTGAHYDTFRQTLFWKTNVKTAERVSVFEGDMADVRFENCGFSRYIGVQLCTGKPAPAKPGSNIIWVRLPEETSTGTEQ